MAVPQARDPSPFLGSGHVLRSNESRFKMPSRHVLLLVAVFPAIGATVLRRRWIKSLQADTSQNTGVSLRDPDPPSTGGPDNPFEIYDPPPAIPGGAPGRGHPAPHLQSLPIIRHSTHVFPFTGDLNRAVSRIWILILSFRALMRVPLSPRDSNSRCSAPDTCHHLL